MDNNTVILWDIGNVFLKPIHGEILHAVYDFGIRNCTFDEFKSKAAKVLDLSFYGQISVEQTWQMLFNISGVVDSTVQNKIKISYTVERNETLIKKASVLSKKCRLGIVSDLSQIGYYTLQTHFKDLLGYCASDLIFISVNHGLTKVKDGNQWFTEILECISIPAYRVVYIDDDIKNVCVASQCGINAIHYRKTKNRTWDEANRLLFNELPTILTNLYGGVPK